MNINKYNFAKLPKNIIVKGNFDESCEILVSDWALSALEKGDLKINIIQRGSQEVISRFHTYFGCKSGNIYMTVAFNDANVHFGDGSLGSYDVRLWRNSKVFIGTRTSSNGVRIECDNSDFITGNDCMFSDTILIQTADQHGLVDLERGEIVNENHKITKLGDHVWLGRQSCIMPNSSVGDGSVVGANAVVVGHIPDKVVAVGVPARVIKKNWTWSRSPDRLDAFSESYIAQYRTKSSHDEVGIKSHESVSESKHSGILRKFAKFLTSK